MSKERRSRDFCESEKRRKIAGTMRIGKSPANIEDVVGRIEQRAIASQKKGLDSVFLLDIDGTVLDARAYTWSLFLEWAKQYRGAVGEKIRRAIREVPGKPEAKYLWNGKFILRWLKIDHPGAQRSVKRYHDRNFFDAERRANEMQPIEGMVRLVETTRQRLRKQGIRLMTTFVSLRSENNDRLRDGRLAAEISLRKAGVWDSESDLVFYRGETIDWDDGCAKEPQKAPLVGKWLSENRDKEIVAVSDNTPNHLNGLMNFLGKKIVFILVEGDVPPGAQDLDSRALRFDPIVSCHSRQT